MDGSTYAGQDRPSNINKSNSMPISRSNVIEDVSQRALYDQISKNATPAGLAYAQPTLIYSSAKSALYPFSSFLATPPPQRGGQQALGSGTAAQSIISAENNQLTSYPLNSLFNFEIDNKGINYYNQLGLKKTLFKFKFFRYFRYSGVHTGNKKVISYNFIKNSSRTNAINSIDHTGSLLKLSISVILKYFFKLMGLALISRPVYIFNHNKVIIQISYYINRKIFFLNNNARSNLLYLMIYNNNAMLGHGRDNLLFNLNKILDSAFGYYNSTFSANYVNSIN